jgi:glycolate oxidase FAD binding subunit
MDLAELVAAELGADVVDTDAERRAACAVDGVVPAAVIEPADRTGIGRAVALAEQCGAALVPRGNGTHVHIGAPPERYDAALRTRRLDRILRHDAADMTVAVEAGATLAELDAVLRPAGQWLPLDPPRPDLVTIGGLLAADLNGGLRFSHGKPRDYLIGVRAVTGGGVLVRGGGDVVKNVAGYDLPKLLIGSFGSLGVIVEATFKVRPRPVADITLAAPCATLAVAAERARALLDAPLAPFAVDLCDAGASEAIEMPASPHVLLRLGGEPAEVAVQRERALPLLPGATELDATVIAAMRDSALEGRVTARLALLPTDLLGLLPAIAAEADRFGNSLRLFAHAGSGILRLQFDDPAPLPYLHWLRFLAHQHAGHLQIERLPTEAKHEIDVWGPTPTPIDLLRRVKHSLDPHRTFSPGRNLASL